MPPGLTEVAAADIGEQRAVVVEAERSVDPHATRDERRVIAPVVGRLVESNIVLPSGEAPDAPEIDENGRSPL